MTSAARAAAASQSSVATAPGCAFGLSAWCAALATTATRAANVLVVGDSIAEGYYAPDRSRRWMDLVRSRLQSDYGGTGLGYIPASDGNPAVPPYPDLWHEGGGTPSKTGLGDRSYTINTANGFAQITVPTDRLQVSYSTSPTGGAMRIVIDGQQAAWIDTYNPQATMSGQTWLSAPLNAGQHTLQILPDNAGHLTTYSVVLEGVMVMNSDDGNGVRLWDSSHAAYTSTHFVSSSNLAADVAQVDPDLLVMELGTNDMTDQVSPSTFESNLQSIITTAQANDSNPLSVVLLPVWDATSHDPLVYDEYVAAEKDLATKDGLGIADLSALDATLYTADGMHPDTAGEQVVSDTLLRLMDPVFASQSTPYPGTTSNPLQLSSPPVPAPTQSVSVTNPSSGVIAAAWIAPSDGTSPFDYYTVDLEDVTSGSSSLVASDMTGGNTAAFAGLSAGHSYLVDVTVKDTSGVSAPDESSLIVLPGPPVAPTGVVATAGTVSGTATVSWVASSSGSPDSYLVQAFDTTTGKFVVQQSVSSTSASFSGLTPGHSYAFAVYAHNSYGYQSAVASNTVTLN